MLNADPRLSTFQIHPSLRCNLACRHCYSVSGPHGATVMDKATILAAIADAASLGYRRVVISGGEPFLYPHLTELCTAARAHGLRTAVVTNGHFLDERHLAPLAPVLDQLVVSVDGPPALHAHMRGSARSLDRLTRGLGQLRSLGIGFGLIHTLTRRSLPHLEWVLRFALAEQAVALQLHPLEPAGRGAGEAEEAITCQADLRRVMAAVTGLNASTGRIRLQLDLYAREQVLAGLWRQAPATLSPASVHTLVLAADGTVLPYSATFARRFALGSVRQARLAALWLATGPGPLAALAAQARAAVAALPPGTLFDWNSHADRLSHGSRAQTA